MNSCRETLQEEVLNHGMIKGVLHYLVKWLGYGALSSLSAITP
jgi:hypothetical protein